MSRPRVSRTVAGMCERCEDGLEALDRLPRGSFEASSGVVRDEIDLEGRAVEHGRERPGRRRRVVHSGEQHVLDEHLASPQRDVAAALREDVLERVAVVDRHELRAERRVGGVDREREPDRLLDLVDEAAESGHPADRRDRRPPGRHTDVGQPQRRREHRVDVQERLAHAHVHDVVHGLDAAEVEHLVEDLGRRQIPAEAHLPGRAERARERAAGLRREADGTASVAIAHEDSLDGVPVVRPEERLDRSVAGLALGHDLEGGERHLRGEPRAEALRERRHLVVGRGAACRPLPHLTCAVARLAEVGEQFVEAREIHRRTVA